MNKPVRKKSRQVAVSLILAILAACFVSVSVCAEPEIECEHHNLGEAELHWNDSDVTYVPIDDHDHQIIGIGWSEARCFDCGEVIFQERVEIREKQSHQFDNDICVLCDYELIKGWKQIDGAWYFFEGKGVKATGWRSFSGIWYYFDENGVMATGWKNVRGTEYYFDENGMMATGWRSFNGTWYFFNDNGIKATGWRNFSGTWYYFDSSGVMATGWRSFSGTWYYFDLSGIMATGWRSFSGTWYYFDSKGIMATGWRSFDGTWYYFDLRGIMATGWRSFSGTWYYFDKSGAMAKGWRNFNGSWYYFKFNGCMAANEWLRDGNAFCWMSSTGICTTNYSSAAKAQVYSSNTNYLILVDRSMHFVTMYMGSKNHWSLVSGFPCGDGKASTPTITGQFSIPSKYPKSQPYFDSGSARCWYPTRINGGYLFHSVLYYQTGSPSRIMDGTLGKGVSHGCVRLALNNAKWIYDNIPIGTKVVIF